MWWDWMWRFVWEEEGLSKVGADGVLEKIFEPYSSLIRLFGLLPIRVSGGVVKARLWSRATLFTALSFATFLIDSSLFVPMYISLLGAKASPAVTHVAQVLFVSGQYAGALVSYLIIPLITPKLITYFAEMQDLIIHVAKLSSSSAVFLPSYLAARWKIRIWVLSSLSFTSFCLYTFGDGIEVYLEGERGWIYWMYYGGFCGFPFLISMHILHSMIFTTLGMTLRCSFAALRSEVEKGQGVASSRGCELYLKINGLVLSLGHIYGIYVVVEVVIMITCVTSNLFFFISQLDSEVKGLYVYSFLILPYLASFHWICAIGQTLTDEGAKCLKAIKQCGIRDPENNLEWTILEEPSALSASNYFDINTRLFTTVVGTITTYLLVMLQFKVAHPATHVNMSTIGTNNYSQVEPP